MMKRKNARRVRTPMRLAVAVTLAATAGCVHDDGEQELQVLRDAAHSAGSRLIVTLPLEERPTNVGGGMYLVVASGPDGEDASDPILFYVLAAPQIRADDPTESLDLYPDVEHELHLVSEPLTEDQADAVADAGAFGTYLDFVTDVPLSTVAPGVVEANVAAIDGETDAFIPGGVIYAGFSR